MKTLMSNSKISVGITGVGSYLPERVLTNSELEEIVETTDEWIKSMTGISERRIVSEDEATSDLGFRAAQRALESAGLVPNDIDLIICSTITSDLPWPATACLIQNKLGANKAAAFDVSAACSGFVYGLSIGMQFIQSGNYKRVLVIGAECLSRVLNWEDRNTCVLFGDGAGAVVLEEVESDLGILSFELGTEGSGVESLCVPSGGSKRPTTLTTIEEKSHYLTMAGKEVFKFAVKIMGESAVRTIEKAGLTKEDIDLLIPHQANIRIIEAAAKRLDLPMEKVMVNIDKYGNTSGASIPIALDEAIKEGKIQKGDNIVLVGFGAGLTWASAVIKWSKA
jgi:3-oxoacyl-[acyl-carrier-protein] synthase III